MPARARCIRRRRGAPVAYFGGEIHGTVITNHSGRFSAGSTTTPEHLANVATLLNCYGITAGY